jgi:hypothetical protein
MNTSPEEVPNTYMENRIDRSNDERLYQPQIHSERIRTLYNLKQATGKPMTVLLDQAIRDLAANYGVIYQFQEEPVLTQVEQETWEEIAEYRRFLDQLEYQRCLDELDEVMRTTSPQVNGGPFENDNR